jgi:hypothetical protein
MLAVEFIHCAYIKKGVAIRDTKRAQEKDTTPRAIAAIAPQPPLA